MYTYTLTYIHVSIHTYTYERERKLVAVLGKMKQNAKWPYPSMIRDS